MPSSIPYDHPSLVLGNVVNPLILSKLKSISALQGRIEAAQDKMNSHISLKRSLEMTINELINMNVDMSTLQEKMKEVDASIAQAATDYATVRLSNETSIQSLKEEISQVEDSDMTESPLDYDRTEMKKMPLLADSLKLDAQYFSYEEDSEDSSQGTVSAIESYIKETTSNLGAKASTDVSKTASAQIALQRKNHSVSGTLVITASCTHKNAVLLSPLVLDIDKAITVWNAMHADNKINTGDVAMVQEIADKEEDEIKNSIPLLSGAAYGS